MYTTSCAIKSSLVNIPHVTRMARWPQAAVCTVDSTMAPIRIWVPANPVALPHVNVITLCGGDLGSICIGCHHLWPAADSTHYFSPHLPPAPSSTPRFSSPLQFPRLSFPSFLRPPAPSFPSTPPRLLIPPPVQPVHPSPFPNPTLAHLSWGVARMETPS